MSLIAALALVALPPAETPAAAPADEVVYTLAYNVSDLLGGGDGAIGELADRVVAAADRDSWATFGGRGVIRPSAVTESLVVRQTRAGHEAIVDALTAWRRMRRQATVAIHLIEVPADASFVPPAVDAAGRAVLTGEARRNLLAAAQADARVNLLFNPKMIVFPGREASISSGGNGSPGVAVRILAGVEDAEAGVITLAVAHAEGVSAPPPGPGLPVPAGGALLLARRTDAGSVLLVAAPTVQGAE